MEKKYVVRYSVHAYHDVTVFAETEAEALDLANDEFELIDMSEFEFSDAEQEGVVDIEEYRPWPEGTIVAENGRTPEFVDCGWR